MWLEMAPLVGTSSRSGAPPCQRAVRASRVSSSLFCRLGTLPALPLHLQLGSYFTNVIQDIPQLFVRRLHSLPSLCSTNHPQGSRRFNSIPPNATVMHTIHKPTFNHHPYYPFPPRVLPHAIKTCQIARRRPRSFLFHTRLLLVSPSSQVTLLSRQPAPPLCYPNHFPL